MKYLILILLMPLANITFGQSSYRKRIDLGKTEKLPMRNAKAYYEEYYGTALRGGTGGVNTDSKNDSVFSICDGVVNAVFDLGDHQTLVWRDKQDLFYALTGIDSVTVKRGDWISCGTFLGLCNFKKDDNYSLFCIISDSKGNYLREDKVWELIRKAEESLCLKESITFSDNRQ